MCINSCDNCVNIKDHSEYVCDCKKKTENEIKKNPLKKCMGTMDMDL